MTHEPTGLGLEVSNLRTCLVRFAFDLAGRAQELPTYLVPQATSAVVRAWGRRHRVDVCSVADAVVVNGSGAVIFHEVRAERGVAPAGHSCMSMASGTGQFATCVDVHHGGLPYLMSCRYAFAASGLGHGLFESAWTEGRCWLGEAREIDGVPVVPLVIDYDLDDTLLVFVGGAVVPLSAVGAVHSRPLQAIYLQAAVQIASAIATAVGQLDHIRRGCTVLPGAHGSTVLTE